MTKYKFPDYSDYFDVDRRDTNTGYIGLLPGEREDGEARILAGLIFSKKNPNYFLAVDTGDSVGGGNDGIVPVPRRRNNSVQPSNYDLATNPTEEEFSPPTQSEFYDPDIIGTDSTNIVVTHDTIVMGQFNVNSDLLNQSVNPMAYYITKTDGTEEYAYIFNDCRSTSDNTGQREWVNESSCNLSEVDLIDFVKHKENKPDILCITGHSRYPVTFDPVTVRKNDGTTETQTSLSSGKTVNFWKVDYNNERTIKLDFDHVEPVAYEVPPSSQSSSNSTEENVSQLSYHGNDSAFNNVSTDDVSASNTTLTPGWSDQIATRKVEAILTDETNSVVFLVYDKVFSANGSGADVVAPAKIVAVDISDVTNITKLAEYTIDSSSNTRMDTIANVVMDDKYSVIFFTTSNGSGLHDTIRGVYFDKASRTFTQRCTFSPNPRTNYTCIERYSDGINEYLYAGNNVYKNSNGNDVLRNQTGLLIHKLTNSLQSIEILKVHQLDSVWNGQDLPVDNVDFGYLKRSPTVPYLIKLLDNDLLYVVYYRSYEWLTNDDRSTPVSSQKNRDEEYMRDRGSGTSNNRNLVYIYKIDSGTELTTAATHSYLSIDTISEPRPFRMLGKDALDSDDKTSDGINYAPFFSPFTSLPSPVSMILERNLSRDEIVLLHQGSGGYISKFHLDRLFAVDRTNLTLLQEFNYEDTPYGLDYYSAFNITADSEKQLMAVANGSQGVKVYFWRESSNSYQPLVTLRPTELLTTTTTDEEGNETETQEEGYAKITKVLMHGVPQEFFNIICFSEQNIYNYSYSGETNQIDLVQTVKYNDLSPLLSDNSFKVMQANISDNRSISIQGGGRGRLNFFINVNNLTLEQSIGPDTTPSPPSVVSPPTAPDQTAQATGSCSYCITIRSTKEYELEGSTFTENQKSLLLADCRAASPAGNGSEDCQQCVEVISRTDSNGLATHYRWQKGVRICSSRLIGSDTIVDNTMCTEDTSDFMNLERTGCAEYFDAQRFSGAVFNVYNCVFEEGGSCEGLDQSELL